MVARRQPVGILELRLVLLGVNPLIWRRRLVPADASVADLHDTFQTAEGAHLLMQVRTRELNGDLEETFRYWYPRFRADAAVDQDALVS